MKFFFACDFKAINLSNQSSSYLAVPCATIDMASDFAPSAFGGAFLGYSLQANTTKKIAPKPQAGL